MSKVTSKYQVSIPKTLAEKIRIRVGDELEWEEAAGTLRARAATLPKAGFSVSERLRLFDDATARQEKRARAGYRAARAGAGLAKTSTGDDRAHRHQRSGLSLRSQGSGQAACR